jgi:site-specific recombinase XerD
MATAVGWWDGWSAAMRRRNLAPGTIEARRYQLRLWSTFIGDRWRVADRHDVEAWIDSRSLAARARYSSISHLHAFYVWCRREGLVEVDPTELVERPRLERRLPRPARAGDVARAVGDGLEPLEVCAALAAYQGLRCVELARLRWQDVDLEAGRLYLRGKGNRDRVLRIARRLRPILQAHDGATGYLLGRRVTPARMSQRLNQHLRARGCQCTAHQLRHAFACSALEASGNIAAVQQALGHASIATTQIYAAVANTVVDDLFDRL